jgi:hypothetical protein
VPTRDPPCAILTDLGRHEDALVYDREALELYAMLARNDPDLYEKTYQHHLAELRRTYDLRGDHSTSLRQRSGHPDAWGADPAELCWWIAWWVGS